MEGSHREGDSATQSICQNLYHFSHRGLARRRERVRDLPGLVPPGGKSVPPLVLRRGVLTVLRDDPLSFFTARFPVIVEVDGI